MYEIFNIHMYLDLLDNLFADFFYEKEREDVLILVTVSLH